MRTFSHFVHSVDKRASLRPLIFPDFITFPNLYFFPLFPYSPVCLHFCFPFPFHWLLLYLFTSIAFPLGIPNPFPYSFISSYAFLRHFPLSPLKSPFFHPLFPLPLPILPFSPEIPTLPSSVSMVLDLSMSDHVCHAEGTFNFSPHCFFFQITDFTRYPYFAHPRVGVGHGDGIFFSPLFNNETNMFKENYEANFFGG